MQGKVQGKVPPETPRDNVIGHRIADGYRFLMPSMCDHDLYAGMGNEYPNNPNWPDGDRVEGLLATMAAINFTARGNGLSGAEALPAQARVQGARVEAPGGWVARNLAKRSDRAHEPTGDQSRGGEGTTRRPPSRPQNEPLREGSWRPRPWWSSSRS